MFNLRRFFGCVRPEIQAWFSVAPIFAATLPVFIYFGQPLGAWACTVAIAIAGLVAALILSRAYRKE